MKTASLKEIKTELNEFSTNELRELCLRLAKSKKENKEFITYILFESRNEDVYIEGLKNKVAFEFDALNTKSSHYIKKGARKILRELKKYIRYSQKKETEVELLIYYCRELLALKPSIRNNATLFNIYSRQLDLVQKRILALHEDLQYDYNKEIKDLQQEDIH